MSTAGEYKYNLIDLFSGAGGLSNGFEQTGRFKVVGAVEINKEAVETYIYNHGKKREIIIKSDPEGNSDITKIDFKNFLVKNNIDRNSTVVIGGPPCQGFSNANRQKNYLISGNNQLVKEFVRAIDEIRPLAFLMENVKNIQSQKHKFFITKDDSKGIHLYSSERHLSQISKLTNTKPFWREDTLVLIDTTNVALLSIVSTLITEDIPHPLLSKNVHLSRIRSIVRELKKEKLYNARNLKEKQEIQSIIEELQKSTLTEVESTSGLIERVTFVLKLIIEGNNKRNEEVLNVLLNFIDINQLLRYLKEVEEENILCLEKPNIYISENRLKVSVKVFSYNVVKYLEVFFDSLGYEIDSEVLLASNFCVPQNRSRYMILGVCKKMIEDKEVHLPNGIKSSKLPFTVLNAIEDLENIAPTTEVSDSKLIYKPSCSTIMQEYYRSEMKEDVIYNHINTASKPLSKERFIELNENNGKNFHSLSADLKEISYTNVSRTQNTIYLRLRYDEPSPTVVNVRKSMWQHPKKPQALSIREAARLQSFKDNFIFMGTKDKQYQQIGNAVPPLLARAVAEQLLTILGKEPVSRLRNEFNI